MRLLGEADVLIITYLLPSLFTEPSVGEVLIHELERLWGKQQSLIVGQDSLQTLIHPFVREEGSSVLILHELNEDGVDWESHQIIVRIIGGSPRGSIDEVDHIVAGAEGDSGALENAILPIHPQNRVSLNQFVEVGD